MTNKTNEQKLMLKKSDIEAMAENPVLGAHYTVKAGGMYLLPESALDSSFKDKRDSEDRFTVVCSYEAVIDRTYSKWLNLKVSDIPEGVIDSDGNISDEALQSYIHSYIDDYGIDDSSINSDDMDELGFSEDEEYENSGRLTVDIHSAMTEAKAILKVRAKDLSCPMVEIGGELYVCIEAKASNRSEEEEEALKIA